MKLYKLQVLLLLSITGSTSVTALPRKAVQHDPFYRRDHGNPFLSISPTQSSTVVAPVATPTPAVIPTTAAAPSSTPAISTPTTASSSQLTSSTIISTSSITETLSSSSTGISPSSSSIPTTTTTPIAAAPIQTAPAEAPNQSSSSDRTWVIVGIFGLAFSLAGLVVFLLLSSRRRARRHRARALKREVELIDVGDAEGAGGNQHVERSPNARKIGDVVILDEDRMKMERKGKMEKEGEQDGKGEEEWEQALPAYCR